jgi:hypothetical protein
MQIPNSTTAKSTTVLWGSSSILVKGLTSCDPLLSRGAEPDQGTNMVDAIERCSLRVVLLLLAMVPIQMRGVNTRADH